MLSSKMLLTLLFGVAAGQQNVKYDYAYNDNWQLLSTTIDADKGNVVGASVLDTTVSTNANRVLTISTSAMVNIYTFTNATAVDPDGRRQLGKKEKPTGGRNTGNLDLPVCGAKCTSTAVAFGEATLELKVVDSQAPYSQDQLFTICSTDSAYSVYPASVVVAARFQRIEVGIDLELIDTNITDGDYAEFLELEASVSVAFGLNTTSAHTVDAVATPNKNGLYDVVACYKGSTDAYVFDDALAPGANDAKSYVAVGKPVLITSGVARPVKDFDPTKIPTLNNGGSMPSSKFVANVYTDDAYLYQINSDTNTAGELLGTMIKAPTDKELQIQVGGNINIETFQTTVAENQDVVSTTTAEGFLDMEVRYALVGEVDDICKDGTLAAPGKVTFASRKVTVQSQLDLEVVCNTPSNGNCTLAAEQLNITGDVTFALGLATLDYFSFEFLAANLANSGVYEVYACYDMGTATSTLGNVNNDAYAFVGVANRAVTVREVRATSSNDFLTGDDIGSAKFTASFSNTPVSLYGGKTSLYNGDGEIKAAAATVMPSKLKIPEGADIYVSFSASISLVTLTQTESSNKGKGKGRRLFEVPQRMRQLAKPGSGSAEASATAEIEIRYAPYGTSAQQVCTSGSVAAPGKVVLESRTQTLETSIDVDIVDLDGCASKPELGGCIGDLLDVQGTYTLSVGLETAAARRSLFVIEDPGVGDYSIVACVTGYGNTGVNTEDTANFAYAFVGVKSAMLTATQVKG